MRTGQKGIALIRKWEAFRAFAYPDVKSLLAEKYPKAKWGFKPAEEIFKTLPASARNISGAPWTVGYGETVGVDMYSTRNQNDAVQHLLSKLVPEEQALTRMLAGVPTTQGQFDAMMALLWNIGEPNFKKSSVLSAHKRGDYESASRAFKLFNKARNRTTKQLEVVDGLTNRRAEEAAVYSAASPKSMPKVTPITAVADEAVMEPAGPEPMSSQLEVAPESTPSQSPINRSAVAGGTAATVAAAAETTRAVSEIRDNAMSMQDLLIPALLIAVVVLFGYIMYQRYKQRKEGWA